MKIKLTKEQLDKMILESIENKINSDIDSDIEEGFDDVESDVEYNLPNNPMTKGTITAAELLKPGKFFKDTDM
jgi:hypothetical protein